MEVQLLERDHAVADAERTKILAVAHHELRDPGQAGILERTQQETVDLLAALLGPEVVRACEVDRVDLLVGNEVGDLDRPISLGARCLEVLVLHQDVLAGLELEGLDHLVVRDGLVLELANLLVSDRALVGLVDEVEVQLVLGDRAVQAHRHVDEAEADRARPDRPWHPLSLPSGGAEKTPRGLTHAPSSETRC